MTERMLYRLNEWQQYDPGELEATLDLVRADKEKYEREPDIPAPAYASNWADLVREESILEMILLRIREHESGIGEAQNTELPPSPIDIDINLETIRGVYSLDDKKDNSPRSVPPGSVFILLHDNEPHDHDGQDEVYYYGEEVVKSHLRRKARAVNVELAEFPGHIDIIARKKLLAISQRDDEVATFELSIPVQLNDPILFLRRAGLGWRLQGNNRAWLEALRRKESEWHSSLRNWIQLFICNDIQLWSGEQRKLVGRIAEMLDRKLAEWGLGIDTGLGPHSAMLIDTPRYYPKAANNIALQFAKAEKLVLEAAASGKTFEDSLDDRALAALQVSVEQPNTVPGESLFEIIRGKLASADSEHLELIRSETADLLKRLAAPAASGFIMRLYTNDDPQENEIKLSEQVMLSAIRNPVLAVGEWLEMG